MEIEVELYARGGGAVSYYWLVVSNGAVRCVMVLRGACSKGQDSGVVDLGGQAWRRGMVWWWWGGVDTRYDSGGENGMEELYRTL